jgi:predicted MFS family arabinose efflux permease
VGDFLGNNKRLLTYVLMSNFMLFFGFQVWQTLFNNYAVEELAIGPAGVGLVQAVREIPGLLGFLLAFLALVMSETRIMAISTILLGIGILLTGGAIALPLLLVATLIMSFGFHFFSAASSSVVLMAVKQNDAPRILGSLGSIGSIAAVAGTLVVFFLAEPLGYRTLWIGVGIFAIVVGLILLPNAPEGEGLPVNRRIIMRKRYGLYYSLSFLMGCRRHIFSTFAIYLLVREYGIPVQTTAMLFLANSIINIFTLRWAGKLVGQLGERVALSISFGALIFVFLGYAMMPALPVLFALFVLDNVLFGFNIALSTYFQKIAVSPEEITSNVSVEQAVNHIAAVIVPIIGGVAWTTYGPQATFLVGVLIVLASLILAQFVRTSPTTPVAAPAPTG